MASTPVDPDSASAPLAAVARVLRCPVCGEPVWVADAVLACGLGHHFDIARQGYVNLIAGRGGPGTADSAAMVAARESFLGRGHYARIASATAEAAAEANIGTDDVVVDLAGGTGYYLAHLLDEHSDAVGICVDLSSPALRRAARAHARAAAIGADAWGVLPIASGAVRVLLSVFGPRNPDEIERVLTPDGTMIVVSPTPNHLQELAQPLGLLAVDPAKPERQAAAFSRFHRLARRTEQYSIVLDRDDLAAVVGMGPSAVHIDASVLRERVGQMPERITVTVSVEVASYRR
ncbi:MAG: putative RNA methyltransferase [Jatrophihabitans sp.]